MFIKIENIRYNIEVKGEGKPIICLHGFSENISTWEFLELNGYQLILIDLIGHGKSDKPISGKYYSVKIMIEHLHKIICKLGFINYSMLGYSMGGRIALAYALSYQSEIDKLILESASYGEVGFFNRLTRKKSDLNLAKRIKKNGIEWFSNYWGELSIFKSQSSLDACVIDKIKERRLANSAYALSNTLKGIGQGKFPCLKNKIVNLGIPILYLSGEYDKKYKIVGMNFKRLNFNIKHIVISDCGHNTHVEVPNTFKYIVNEFLKE